MFYVFRHYFVTQLLRKIYGDKIAEDNVRKLCKFLFYAIFQRKKDKQGTQQNKKRQREKQDGSIDSIDIVFNSEKTRKMQRHEWQAVVDEINAVKNAGERKKVAEDWIKTIQIAMRHAKGAICESNTQGVEKINTQIEHLEKAKNDIDDVLNTRKRGDRRSRKSNGRS